MIRRPGVLVPAASELPRQYSAMRTRCPGRVIIEIGRASGVATVVMTASCLAKSRRACTRSKPLWSLRELPNREIRKLPPSGAGQSGHDWLWHHWHWVR